MSKIDILLFNDLNDIIEEININKPKTYSDLLSLVKIKLKNLPNNYSIFFISDKKEIAIKIDEDYKLSKDILFIRPALQLDNHYFQ